MCCSESLWAHTLSLDLCSRLPGFSVDQPDHQQDQQDQWEGSRNYWSDQEHQGNCKRKQHKIQTFFSTPFILVFSSKKPWILIQRGKLFGKLLVESSFGFIHVCVWKNLCINCAFHKQISHPSLFLYLLQTMCINE